MVTERTPSFGPHHDPLDCATAHEVAALALADQYEALARQKAQAPRKTKP